MTDQQPPGGNNQPPPPPPPNQSWSSDTAPTQFGSAPPAGTPGQASGGEAPWPRQDEQQAAAPPSYGGPSNPPSGPPSNPPSNPQSPPYGTGSYGQQPPPPYGQPGAPSYGGQPGYGQPQAPQGYPPQPGMGQGGYGQGGPPPGYSGPPAPPPGGKSNKGLLIGLGVVALVLIIGIVAAVVLMNKGDDNNNSADATSDATTSEPTSPSSSGSSSDATSDATSDTTSDATSEPTDTASTGSGTVLNPDGNGQSFVSDYGLDAGTVCTGSAMTNAAPWNPDKPKLMAFNNSPIATGEYSWAIASLGSNWEVGLDKYEKVGAMVCLDAVQGTEEKTDTCKVKNDNGKKVPVNIFAVDYHVVFREATTGKVLGEGGTVRSAGTYCPMFVPTTGNDYYDTPTFTDTTAEVESWLATQ